MSDLPFLPPFDDVMRLPPVLRFKGVKPGSPEAAALAKAFGPYIRQFYQGMAQQYAVSPNKVMRGARQFGDDLKMEYVNQFGIEYVTVDVRPGAMARQEPEEETPLWDMAIVEVYVPNVYEAVSGFQSWAYVTNPLVAEITPTSVRPVDGVDSGTESPLVTRAGERALIKAPWGGSTKVNYNIIDTTSARYASYLLDFRGIGPVEMVEVDLNTILEVFQPLPDYTIYVSPDPLLYPLQGYAPSGPPDLTDDPTSGNNWYGNAYQFDYSYNGPQFPDSGPEPPRVLFDSASNRWVFSATNRPAYTQLGEHVVEAPPLSTINGVDITDTYYWNRWYVVTTYPEGYYTGPEVLPAQVQVSMFKGFREPDFLGTRVTPVIDNNFFLRWVRDYPSIPAAQRTFDCTIATAEIGAVSGTLYNRFNIPRTGKVFLDRVNGSSSFKAAD